METAAIGAEMGRRSLSQRGAVTRQKLLDAAIGLLSQRGYAATTTQAVTELAGVSRGSLLHQFQTRLDLMVATATYAVERTMADVDRNLDEAGHWSQKLESYTDILWLVQNQPHAIALTEIYLAARWDAGLSERLKSVMRDVAQLFVAKVARVAEQQGLSDVAGLVTHLHTLIAAMRGLAIERTFAPDDISVERALELPVSYTHLTLPTN